jgi:hypothetical protein
MLQKPGSVAKPARQFPKSLQAFYLYLSSIVRLIDIDIHEPDRVSISISLIQGYGEANQERERGLEQMAISKAAK